MSTDLGIRKVFCSDCGVIRMAKPDIRASEKDGARVTKKTCPVCDCPYVELVTEEHNN